MKRSASKVWSTLMMCGWQVKKILFLQLVWTTHGLHVTDQSICVSWLYNNWHTMPPHGISRLGTRKEIQDNFF